MIVNQYKVAILSYMLIVLQVQPEFNQDHHYRPYYKHSHDHNHAHHLKHQMEHNHEHHHKHAHAHDHDHHRRSTLRKSSRIYNGVRASPGQGKFMAVMVKDSGAGCSAVIITGDMLLTAAHCFENQTIADWLVMRILPRALSIQTYRNNPNSDHPLMKRIINYWIHPRYHPSNSDTIYDIAIIRVGPEPWLLGELIDSALMPVRVTHVDWRVIKGYGYGLETGQRDASHLNEMNFRHYYDRVPYARYQILNNERNIYFIVTNWSPQPNLNPRVYRNMAPGDSGGGIFILGTVERLDRSTNRIIYKTGLILVGIIIRGTNYSLANADLSKRYGTWAVNVTTMMPWINSIVGVDFVTYPFPILSTGRIG